MNDPVRDAIRKVVTDKVASANTIGEIWALFEAATLVAGTDARQRRDAKRAFYSGAAAAFELYRQTGDPGFEEDAGVKRLQAINRELVQFAEDIAKGRA